MQAGRGSSYLALSRAIYAPDIATSCNAIEGCRSVVRLRNCCTARETSEEFMREIFVRTVYPRLVTEGVPDTFTLLMKILSYLIDHFPTVPRARELTAIHKFRESVATRNINMREHRSTDRFTMGLRLYRVATASVREQRKGGKKVDDIHITFLSFVSNGHHVLMRLPVNTREEWDTKHHERIFFECHFIYIYIYR